LLDLARTATVADVRRAAKRIRFYLDPDGTTAAALAAYDDQMLRVTESGSMLQVDDDAHRPASHEHRSLGLHTTAETSALTSMGARPPLRPEHLTGRRVPWACPRVGRASGPP
jgi:hypothetical protein